MIRRLMQEVAARAQEALTGGPVPDRRRMHRIEVWVLNGGEHASTEALFAKAAAALDRIAEAQPWRIGTMQRDFGRIFIRQNTGCRAMFDTARSCVLDTYFVAVFTPEQVASSIVHESVHARLRRDGRVVPADLIAWEERLCRRAELGFGLRVPDGAAVVERAHNALALSDADVAPLAGNIRLRPTRRRGPG
ncbi:MAG TPA: hypothetical protein VK358_15425 [Longimicrobium sp.]|nr:hypothetical protein [Longimicrobium sp.]